MTEKQFESITFSRQISQRMLEIARAKVELIVSESGFDVDSPVRAKVVGINQDRQVIGISSLRDSQDNPVALTGRHFFVVCQVDGITYKFVARLTSSQTCNGVNFVEFPEELFYLQRRAHYRVPVPAGQANFVIDGGGVAAISGNLRDLSVAGMRVLAVSSSGINFDIGCRLPRCRLRIGESEDIRFSAVLRYMQENDEGALYMGLEIDDIDNEHLNFIERYVADRDRELRRKAVGM